MGFFFYPDVSVYGLAFADDFQNATLMFSL